MRYNFEVSRQKFCCLDVAPEIIWLLRFLINQNLFWKPKSFLFVRSKSAISKNDCSPYEFTSDIFGNKYTKMIVSSSKCRQQVMNFIFEHGSRRFPEARISQFASQDAGEGGKFYGRIYLLYTFYHTFAKFFLQGTTEAAVFVSFVQCSHRLNKLSQTVADRVFVFAL